MTVNEIMKTREICHNWLSGNCTHEPQDCEHCEDWWYEPMDEGRVAEKGR